MIDSCVKGVENKKKMVMMRGEQYHHNNPSELCENLYLCAFRAISSKVMLDLGITCSINATVELPTFAYQKQDCMQIAVEDRVSDKDRVFTILSLLTEGQFTLLYSKLEFTKEIMSTDFQIFFTSNILTKKICQTVAKFLCKK